MPYRAARARSRRRIRFVVVAGVGAFGLLLGAVPAWATQPTPVLHSHFVEEVPAGGGGFLFWSENSTADPDHESMFGKQSGHPRFQVNAAHTQGFAGSIDDSDVVYQQTNLARTASDLWVYHLDTRTRTKLPSAVNTADWEFYPSMSGDYVAFTRQDLHTGAEKELLFHKGDRTARTLDTGPGGQATMQNGQVNGNYLVWDKCDTHRKCQVYEHDIAANHTTRLANPLGKSQYSASVTADGTVFFGRSGIGCGTHVSVMEDPLHGPQHVVFSLPVGIDFSKTSVVIGTNPTAVLFDHYDCNAQQFDIYRFTA
jgi:hypothetical protein